MLDKLVVETNVLYKFFWKSFPTHKLLRSVVSAGIELISAEFGFKELKKHKEEILFEAKLRANEFNELLKLLSTFVDFKEESKYIGAINEAKSLTSGHLKDVDFFALALKQSCPLWSDEKRHKKQSRVKVFDTEDIRKMLEKSKDKFEFEDR